MATPSDQWTIDRDALDLLLARLAQVAPDAAAEYETLRRRLIGYLGLRGVREPEAAADETLDRVARKLTSGAAIESIRGYVFGVARMVLLETQRRDARERSAGRSWLAVAHDEESAERERRHRCLEQCLGELPAESRALVERYHGGAADRDALAREADIAPGALRTRMHRLRNALADCLAGCLAKGGDR
jgi:DNA-directed RNA polymerase specialized sigma24 family protein